MSENLSAKTQPMVAQAVENEAAEFVLQAILYENEDLLEELLVENAEAANVRDATGRNALHHAALRGRTRCARILIRSGADVDACAGPRDAFKTPLLIASSMGHTELVGSLVDNGADLFYCDANGHTALQLAQMGGHAEVAQALIASIEKTYHKAVQMRADLCAACIDGDRSAVLNILADTPANARSQILNGEQRGSANADEKSALYIACEHGRAEIVRVLLTVAQHSIIYSPSGDTVLHAAVASQDAATVDVIVQKFPYLMSVANNEGSLSLHWACRCGNLEVIQVLLEARYPASELKLIETNAPGGGTWCYKFVCDFNATDVECRTPLYLAVANGNVAVVQYLVDFKMRVYSSNDAISFLSSTTAGKDEDSLSNETDANSHRSSTDAISPHTATNDGRKSADGAELTDENFTRCPFQLDVYCSNGRIALMTACANANLNVVRILLKAGSDVNLPIALTDVEICNLKPMEEARCTGSGALVEAAKVGNLELVRLLFENGALDYDNKALAVAIANDKRDLVSSFLCQLTFRDAEFRINKFWQHTAPRGVGGSALSATAGNLLALGGNASNLLAGGYPSTPCQLNWHNASLDELRLDWLCAAGAFFNARTRHKKLSLSALTRIDLSNNRLPSAPLFLFQLQSLRTLNLEQNCISTIEFPPTNQVASQPSSQQDPSLQPHSPVLEELSLAGNYLDELPLQLFSECHFPLLKVLNVGGNRLKALPPAIWLAPRLRELNAMNNEIVELRTRVGRWDSSSNRTARATASGGGAAERNQRQYYQRRHQSSQNFQRRLQLYQLKLHQTQTDGEDALNNTRGAPDDDLSSSARSPRSAVRRRGDDVSPPRDSAPIQWRGRERTPRTTPPTTPTKAAATSRQRVRRRHSAVSVKDVDVIRVNIWQKKIHLSNIEGDDEDEREEAGHGSVRRQNSSSVANSANRSDGSSTSALRILNLAGNKLRHVPGCLACCCPRLTRLDLSMNEVSHLGAVENLPGSLRHLNMAHNQLIKCFQRAADDPLQFACSAPFGLSAENHIDSPGANLPAGRAVVNNSYAVNRHSRSRSKSVARNQRSLSVIRNDGADERQSSDGTRSRRSAGAPLEPCVHKSHYKLEALKTLNLAHNSLTALELLAAFGVRNSLSMEQFNWKENGQQMKSYLLFPALTTLDVSHNRLRTVPPTVSLLAYLSVFNVSSNVELESLPPELGLLDKLWNVGVRDCPLKEPLKGVVEQDNYKTTEILAILRNKLENSKPYPKMKLMILGGTEVGKSTLLKQVRQEGHVSKKSLQSESWARRMGHSPRKTASSASSSSSTATSQFFNLVGGHTVDVSEWSFEPKRKSSTTSSAKSLPSDQASVSGAVTFRAWDFVGLQREFAVLEQYFFTRRCLYLVVWKVTEGEIALNELHEWLLAIQARAPNSTVLIVGTHLDCVKENSHRFPAEYLTELDTIIQERFVNVSDADKKGLPRVLASIYVSTRSRDDIRALCNLLYQVAAEMRVTTNHRNKLLVEKVPASFLALEKIVVSVTDELRWKGEEPILTFDDFWVLATTQMMEEYGRPFRDILEFRRACHFLHENGVIAYFEDTSLREFVFLDPPWLCAFLCTALLSAGAHNFHSEGSQKFGAAAALRGRRRIVASASTSAGLSTKLGQPESLAANSPISPYESSLVDVQQMYATLKFSLRQFGAAATRLTAGGDVASAVATKFRLFRVCLLSLLSKFELALPCLNKMLLLPSLLPDEYLLRADYPGAKVRIRSKIHKWQLRQQRQRRTSSCRTSATLSTSAGRSTLNSASQMMSQSEPPSASSASLSPIRSYLTHRRFVRRALAAQSCEPASIDRVAKADPTDSPSIATRRLLASANLPQQSPAPESQLSERIKPVSEVTRCCGAKCSDESNATPPKISIQRNQTKNLRRLYVMQYMPPGFWARLTTRLLDDEDLCSTLSRLFVLTTYLQANQQDSQQQNEAEESHPIADLFADLPKNQGAKDDLLKKLNEIFNKLAANESALLAEDAKKLVEEEETSFIIPLPSSSPNSSQKAPLSNSAVKSTVRVSPSTPLTLSSTTTNSASEFLPTSSVSPKTISKTSSSGFEWLLWQTGVEIRSFGAYFFSLKQFLPLASVRDVNYSLCDLRRQADDGIWKTFRVDANQFLIELLIPHVEFKLEVNGLIYGLEIDNAIATKFLSIVTNIVDDLLEDWFPALGTRYVHTSEGRLLVDRLVPCHLCAEAAIVEAEKVAERRRIKAASNDSGRPNSAEDESNNPPKIIHLFPIEECILHGRYYSAEKSPARNIANSVIGSTSDFKCPAHLNLALSLELMAPDVLFADLGALENFVVAPENIRRGKLVGRGAFGFVFNGFVRQMNETYVEVALKVLEPVDPGGLSLTSDEGRKQPQSVAPAIGTPHNLASARAAFEAFRLKWQNDAQENVARAYCTARQELNMLSGLKHAHVTSLLGFSTAPMTLIVELAPHGALDAILTKYRRNNARLHLSALQQTCVQIAKALEYLHTNHIIYRDLKSENVLVWRFPSPHHNVMVSSPIDVHIKLGDYGISRYSYPSGVCKGYGGTEGFMAPEVMRYNGEQEYTERVDSYSFGMFIYELISLKQPYEGRDQMKDFILEGRRPYVSEKELLYPSCVLDLMVTCWSESAESRPSSSQLVGICSAPEFCHLLDIALLDSIGDDENQIAGQIGTIVMSENSELDGEEFSQCWLLTRNVERKEEFGSICVLSASQFGFTEKKIISGGIPPAKLVTALCQVDADTVWLGDCEGNIFVYCVNSFANLLTFSVATAIAGFDWNSIDSEEVTVASECTSYRHAASICHIEPYPERGLVVVAVKFHVLVYRLSSSVTCQSSFSPDGMTDDPISGTEDDMDCSLPSLIATIPLSTSHEVLGFAILPLLGEWQIWTSHHNEKIIIHHMNDVCSQLVFSTSINHFPANSSTGGGAAAKSVESILASRMSSSLVWTTLSKDSRIFQWRHDSAAIRRTLNCAKILPGSESLSSMNLEATTRDVYITTIRLLAPTANSGGGNINNTEKLIVGTNYGVVIIVEAEQMLPLSSFRPYSSAVEQIIVCNDIGARITATWSALGELNDGTNSPDSKSFQQQQISTTLKNANFGLYPDAVRIRPGSDYGSGARRRSSAAASRREIVSAREALGAESEAPAPPKWATGRRLSSALKNRFAPSQAPSSNVVVDTAHVGDSPGSAVSGSPGTLEAIGAKSGELYEAVTRGVKDMFLLGGSTTDASPHSSRRSRSKLSNSAEGDGSFITIGSDYRCLLTRFLGNSAGEETPSGLIAGLPIRSSQDTKRQSCAIFWRSDDWATK